MIKEKLIRHLIEKTGVQKSNLIEKDIILHRLLFELLLDKKFDSEYVFKGGTCLMKCHLGYYRFSEDLDFTWLNQKAMEGKSENQIKRLLSKEITLLASLLEGIAKKMGLDFRPDKQNKRYFDFGGSNAYVTFKFWYIPQGEEKETFIKIQVNYREKLFYPVMKKTAKGMIDKNMAKGFSFLFPEESEFLLKNVKLNVYDLREILIEKIRAILTRKGVKARDFVDVYTIEKEKKLKPEKFEDEIVSKVKDSMRFEKYKINLKQKLKERPTMKAGEEEYLLLKPLGDDLPDFLNRLDKFIEKLIKRLNEEF